MVSKAIQTQISARIVRLRDYVLKCSTEPALAQNYEYNFGDANFSKAELASSPDGCKSLRVLIHSENSLAVFCLFGVDWKTGKWTVGFQTMYFARPIGINNSSSLTRPLFLEKTAGNITINWPCSSWILNFQEKINISLVHIYDCLNYGKRRVLMELFSSIGRNFLQLDCLFENPGQFIDDHHQHHHHQQQQHVPEGERWTESK